VRSNGSPLRGGGAPWRYERSLPDPLAPVPGQHQEELTTYLYGV
jgi:hypothetical protein